MSTTAAPDTCRSEASEQHGLPWPIWAPSGGLPWSTDLERFV